MKKLLFFFSFLFFTFHTSSAQGVWTWMSGDTVLNSSGLFGRQGIPSVNNFLPSAYGSFCWTDLQGNFWLYGASDASSNTYGDLWKFNPATLEWTWVNGPGIINPSPVYGTIGVAAPGNTPGGRSYLSCGWVDTSGDLWLYGGFSQSWEYADLWKYNIASNEWTWMLGPSSINQLPVYGTQGIPSPSNNPGGRAVIGNPWVDENNKFWLYGGLSANFVFLSDMWMYDPVINMWTWESGSQAANVTPVYGSKGTFSSTNTPGGRYPYTMITENNGIFLLFGGVDDVELFGDLWEYNPFINQWSWVGGSKTNGAPGIAGASCQSDSTFYPNARSENRAAWKDCAGNLWMYGGYTTSQTFGDVWVYLNAAKKWARMSDSAYIDANPVYGTLGVLSLSNKPGAKFGTPHWKDKNGNFWIFWGLNINRQAYCDMWRYIPDSICVNSKCSIATNVYPVSSSVSFQLYPNPANTQLTIGGNLQQGDKLEVVDLLGRTLLTQTISSTTNQQTIDVSMLADGIYFITIKNAEGMVRVRKFVKE